MLNQKRRRWKLRYTLSLIAGTTTFFIFTVWYVARREPKSDIPVVQPAQPSPQRIEPERPVAPREPAKPLTPQGPPELRVGKNERFATLQMAINAAPDGSRIVISEGEYLSDTAILISGKKDLTVVGEGAVSLLLGDKDANVIEVEKCSNIRFENLKVKHTDPPPGDRCSGYVFQVASTPKD